MESSWFLLWVPDGILHAWLGVAVCVLDCRRASVAHALLFEMPGTSGVTIFELERYTHQKARMHKTRRGFEVVIGE
jgi:hypothetical protein